MPYCENCGAKYDKNDSECPQCGKNINVTSLDAKRHQKRLKKYSAIKKGQRDVFSTVYRTKGNVPKGARIDPKKLEAAKKASFIDRALARLIDTMLLVVPNVLASLLVPFVGGIIISALYFVHFYVKSGQTVGHRIVGIKIVSTNGYPITYEQAILRYVGAMLSSVILFIGFLMYFSNPERQTLHDKLAGTYVIAAQKSLMR